jgi:hypothetical protein
MHHFEATPDGTRLSRSENFVPYHVGLEKLLTDGKVLDVISELMGEPAVLYKEKINYKYPGGGGYAPHQDAPAYEFVTFHITWKHLISVDAATPESGCLSFSPGQYDKGFIALDDKGCIAETKINPCESRLDFGRGRFGDGMGRGANGAGGHPAFRILYPTQKG